MQDNLNDNVQAKFDRAPRWPIPCCLRDVPLLPGAPLVLELISPLSITGKGIVVVAHGYHYFREEMFWTIPSGPYHKVAFVQSNSGTSSRALREGR